MNKKVPSYVTETVFKRELGIVHGKLGELDRKIDSVADRLDHKIDAVAERFDKRFDLMDSTVNRLSVAVVKTQAELAEVKENMATKSDIDRVLSQMTDFAKNTQFVLENQEAHRGYIHDHEERLIALEKYAGL